MRWWMPCSVYGTPAWINALIPSLSAHRRIIVGLRRADILERVVLPRLGDVVQMVIQLVLALAAMGVIPAEGISTIAAAAMGFGVELFSADFLDA